MFHYVGYFLQLFILEKDVGIPQFKLENKLFIREKRYDI